ncbi:hypothetical protein LUZ63_001921 [Rhynchospora breviuscula]|uniref:Uncharacterized protein n=1 Tax=Rhynchospora breviuscula TaxID=2022672 RepID=A0A9Q0CYS2_9POAL|nr:hypothetical protein LUZ63_001921 [Rhynchospora breviuscula]
MSKMEAYKRIALVTGGNKGIGLEICRQLALNGTNVILTARDEKRGKEAVEKLTKDYGLTNVIFYRLDVTDLSSIESSVSFVKSQFGKLDILVNNAGIVGHEFSKPIAEKINNGGDRSYILEVQAKLQAGDLKFLAAMAIEPYEKAKECIDINYYGTKAMCEAFIPLLQLSKSPRIVNVSSYFGKLEVRKLATHAKKKKIIW